MVIHYKCPNCGDDMHFDAKTGALTCPACGREDHIDDFPQDHIQEMFTDEEVNEYHCENCGAVLLTDKNTAATKCSYCGAGVVLADRLTGAIAPQLVIPFAISKEEAIAGFKKWARKRLLAPAGFMNADRIKDITGVYVPFWLYDLDSDVEVHAIGTRVRTYVKGDYIYTETKYYQLYRDIYLKYNKVPIDASVKMDDELMDKLEPFPYNQLKDFQFPYLAGYYAEKYQYDDDELFPRAKSKVRKFIDSFIYSTMTGYTNVQIQDKMIHTKKLNAYYALLPVWVFTYDHNREEYLFVMNGQTGKIVGKPPISLGKVAAWYSGITAGVFLLFRLITLAIAGGWFS